jgi:aryl-alcohol dehydrogenase-like predicted oxidoreductase
MQTIPLGPDDSITEMMLGTMTFGTQTPEDDAHRQIDMAVEAGITWLDTAELYPVNPVRTETLGVTEQIIGRWAAKGNAGRIRMATKIVGAGGPARDGARITPDTIRACVEQSLRNLQVEAIDLYQFHWPNRGSYHFRQHWGFRPQGRRDVILQDMADCAGALSREVERGTIRAFGLSNESAWGMTEWMRLFREGACPRPVSIQNEYSLLCRLADTDLAEQMAHDGVTMLAWSPLAAGILTGKYQGGAVPEGSRKALNGDLGGRWNPRTEAATQAYLDLAARRGLDPVHMAIAWCQSRPFACSAIIGASDAKQLERILKADGMRLDADVLAEIDAAHRDHPMPY